MKKTLKHQCYSQETDAESVLLHNDDVSSLRRFSASEIESERLAESDLLNHVLVDEDGGCTPALFPLP